MGLWVLGGLLGIRWVIGLGGGGGGHSSWASDRVTEPWLGYGALVGLWGPGEPQVLQPLVGDGAAGSIRWVMGPWAFRGHRAQSAVSPQMTRQRSLYPSPRTGLKPGVPPVLHRLG